MKAEKIEEEKRKERFKNKVMSLVEEIAYFRKIRKMNLERDNRKNGSNSQSQNL